MVDISMLSRRSLLSIGLGGAASLTMPPRRTFAATARKPIAEDQAVIGVTHSGPISDGGWTEAHHKGVVAVQAAYPKLKVLEAESVPFSSEASRTFRQLIGGGANLIIDSGNHGDFLQQIADREPDVAFLQCAGLSKKDNLGWYFVAHWYANYIIGVAAGRLSKSGKLGYVASFPVPTVFSSTNAMLMGARSVNPTATLQTISINAWFDPQAATQATTALIDNGCDFVGGVMNEPAHLQAAESRHVWAAVWNSDMRRYGPNSYVSSIMVDFTKYYVAQVGDLLAGTWAPGEVLFKTGDGVDRDNWGANVPAEVGAEADAVRKKVIDGWSPFVGELKDSTGKVRVAAGQTMTELELYSWDWSVEGVTGLAG